MANQASVLPTLYKRTSTGAVQEWTMAIKENDDGTAEYTATYGQQDGKMQTSTVNVKQGKNIGRANATTPYEQAFSEAGSKWNKQKDKGYVEEIGNFAVERKPMLAHDYNKYGHKVAFPAFVQPKLDGIRCIAYKTGDDITLMSRNGKSHNLPHLKKLLEPLFKEHPDLVLDGELYIHGIPFQSITSWVKKIQPETGTIEYHIYDQISPQSFKERIYDLGEKIAEMYSTDSLITFVETTEVADAEEVTEFHGQYTRKGYEGIMLRAGDCTYKEGYRSQELLKVKEWIDGEFEIVGAKTGVGKCEDQCIFTCKTQDGEEFDVKCMGTDQERRQQWLDKEKYFGKMLTVKFFEWSTSENPVPRFPIGISVRDYE